MLSELPSQSLCNLGEFVGGTFFAPLATRWGERRPPLQNKLYCNLCQWKLCTEGEKRGSFQSETAKFGVASFTSKGKICNNKFMKALVIVNLSTG